MIFFRFMQIIPGLWNNHKGLCVQVVGEKPYEARDAMIQLKDSVSRCWNVSIIAGSWKGSEVRICTDCFLHRSTSRGLYGKSIILREAADHSAR